MKQFFGSLLLSSIFLFSACGKKTEKGYQLQVQFDELAHYVKNPTLVKTNESHTGQYCVFTDSKNPYGVTFTSAVSDVLQQNAGKIVVTGFCKTSSAACKAAHVLSIENSEGKIFGYEATDIKTFVKTPGEWTAFTTVLKLKNTMLDPNYTIKIYGWNYGSDPVLFDDISIRYE